MTRLIDKPARALMLLCGAATLAACAPESGPGQFFREAGSQLDQGEFGNATLHNQLVQSCRTNSVGGAGGKVGGAIGDPVVVLDPESTRTRRVYRVHCDGRLDGKYATIIYREYVNSATQSQTVTQADAE